MIPKPLWIQFSTRLYADILGSQAYDSHCNLVLGDVEETVYVVDDDAEDDEVKTVSKKSEMLFVRGKCLSRASKMLFVH